MSYLLLHCAEDKRSKGTVLASGETHSWIGCTLISVLPLLPSSFHQNNLGATSYGTQTVKMDIEHNLRGVSPYPVVFFFLELPPLASFNLRLTEVSCLVAVIIL